MIFNLLLFMTFSIFSLSAYNIKNFSFSEQNLYSIQEPRNQGYLSVDKVHQIFFEEFGNPNGFPVLVVHGGPGSECTK